jgi:hypothetical protein
MVAQSILDAWNYWACDRSAQQFMDDSRTEGPELFALPWVPLWSRSRVWIVRGQG